MHRPLSTFDVIVVGGGHAGCEAAAAAARLGATVALLTLHRSDLGAMSCNPAIGGLGKGHLVREVDAFDGLIGRAADYAGIHYRMLNRSKGPAVRGPRIQADRRRYRTAIAEALSEQAGLTILESQVSALLRGSEAQIGGVELGDGQKLRCGAIVLATGTFLNGKLHFGMSSQPGGRFAERAVSHIGDQLRELGLPIARLKTGTPPRLDGRTVDWAGVASQASDDESWTMSPLSGGRSAPQLFCGITRTSRRTHDIIRGALERSPLFTGQIEGTGPRYCPSIEDKVARFGDRDGHQVFLEPEGLDVAEIYPNGISTSLPPDVQVELVRSIAGLERAEIVQPGYAVEYDHVDPRVLDATLAVRGVPGLFLAGQINGTTGYEEAAAQGLVAGINAAHYAAGDPPRTFDRANSYIGVMIDDLTLQGVTEPYRMLTARAEYRLRLRADNASTRLTPLAIRVGCVRPERRRWFEAAKRQRDAVTTAMAEPVACAHVRQVCPSAPASSLSRPLGEVTRLLELDTNQVMALNPSLRSIDRPILEEAVVDLRYQPYVARQEQQILRARVDEAITLDSATDYRSVPGLSNEMVERLDRARPMSLAGAARIRGITPAAIAAILVHARRAG